MTSLLPSQEPLPHNSPLVSKTKEIISKAWGFNKTIQYNPAPNPVSLERKHLGYLKSNIANYVVAEKSDGVRYLLVIGNYERKAFAVMVNRRMQMYEVPIYAHPDYFESGSVFDGELVIETTPHLQQTRQMFLVFDACMVKGETFIEYPFLNRYKTINTIFDLHNKDILNDEISKWDNVAFTEARDNNKIVCLGNHMALGFKPKPAVPMSNLGSLWRSLSTLQHPSDGLILTPTPTPILTGTHNTMFKWKSSHTIDLWVDGSYVKGMWHYDVFYLDDAVKENGQTMGLFVSNTPLLIKTAKYFGDKNRTQFSLLGEFQCKFDGEKVWCILERWRKDKNTPNNKTVIERTLVNVKENILVDELISMTSLQIYGLEEGENVEEKSFTNSEASVVMDLDNE